MTIKAILSAALLSVTGYSAWAQDAFKEKPHLFSTPKNYVVSYTATAPNIDGNIHDPVWQQAAWTDEFVDIEGDLKPKPQFSTKLKILWGDSCLYLAVKMQEPHLWAKLTEHDQVIFQDNDFEIFIDPDNDARNYFEIEINQRNQIFDLFLPKPYRDRGDALISWDAAGMKNAVQLQGSLNNPDDQDDGWTAEFQIPFRDIKMGFGRGAPADGTVWRINFSRVEWDTEVKNGKYVKQKNAQGKNLPERNWVWSAPGIVSMHAPERWGYLQFTKNQSAKAIPFKVPYADLQKQYLWLVYYTQQKYRQQHHTYANSLADLGISS
ncbi:MAG: carbohydrate-binding family 9-like protein, partial [Mucilaginibacter sp.]|nr:carbohydrate-binding family 9-like protein [Mucilaginibacter sp.]